MAGSDVVRVTCAQNIFSASATKNADLKLKNRCKSAEEAKAEHCCLIFLLFSEETNFVPR